jgi:Flp pilus assembly protein TadG
MSLRRLGRGKATHRIAAAVVEFAVTMPVAMIIVFGTIEIANGIFLKQAISEAAYEGARAASRPSGTQVTTRARIREVLASRGIDSETVTFSPSPNGTVRGTKLTVTVSVPASELGAVSPLQYLHNKTFTKSVAMARM